jgi:hypothetical protein
MFGAILGGVSGVANIASGIIGSKKRKREQRAAQREFNMYKSQLANIDTSNLYKNIENVYDDLTVNTQEAEFVAEQQNQGMANTMNAMSSAAGGSGIAALAQAMAGQQSTNAQSAGVSIGNQERQNQLMQKQMANQLTQQEIAGEYTARDKQTEKTQALLGMAGSRLAAANQARQQATQSILGGVGQMMGAAAGMSGMADIAGGGSFGESAGSGFGGMMTG